MFASLMAKKLSSPMILAAPLLLVAFDASAQVQAISAEVHDELYQGSRSSLIVSYQATDNALLSGLGLRVHFNSSEIDVGEVEDLLGESLMAHQLVDDVSDYDEDLTTDKFFLAAWADTQGQWPYTLNAGDALFNLPITPLEGIEETTIKFTTPSAAAGYTFEGSDVVLAVNSSTDPANPANPATPSAANGGGGCTVGPAGYNDSTFPMILLGMGLIFLRRKILVPIKATANHLD